MPRSTRLLMAALSLLLLVAYVQPLWHIELEAPQYPEGLGLQIWANNIAGSQEHDLQKINQLNHYIGMQAIDPASFPELRWIPWIIGALIGLGLITALTGWRPLLYGWVTGFAAVAAVGLWRFYDWAYEYGHNLDPTASIQVPGMTYQPPLIGSKELLNFTAHSWPHVGGWAIFLTMAGGAILAIRTYRRSRRNRQSVPAT